MNDITPENVREFLLAKYSQPIRSMGLDPAELPDSFDFLLRGIIDSFGVLEMVTSIEDEFRIQLDMASIDAEQITILGPLSYYIASIADGEARGQAANGLGLDL
jgi:acyl carrier protein